MDLISMCCFLLQHRRWIARTALLVTVLTLSVVFLLPRTYTTAMSFYPKSSDLSASGLAGLAAQAGLSIPTSDQTQSPDFYTVLVTTDRILRGVVSTVYRFHLDGRNVTSDLVGYYGVNSPDTAIGVAKGIADLTKHITAGADLKTGVVHVEVETKSAELSAAVAAKILELINRYDTETRQTQAGEERRFLEARLDEMRDSLRSAENEMQRFLERNRDLGNSPQLVFEQARLQKVINMDQDVYTNLAQSYERARLDEVRNTPVITMVEEPSVPPLPDRRRAGLKGGIALVLGALLGVLLALFRGRLRQESGGAPSDVTHLWLAWSETLGDLKRPWKLFVGRTG